MPVTKAVLPVAGWGTRMLPATKAVPKELLPIVDRPALEYVVEECAHAGITDVLLVTAMGKAALEDHFDRSLLLEQALEDKGKTDLLEEVRRIARIAEVTSVRQPIALGLGHAVLMGADHVGDASFAVILGDDLVDAEDELLERMIGVHESSGRPVVAVMEVPADQTHLYGIATAEPTDEDAVFVVSDMVEKPDPGAAPSNLAIIGRYVLDSGVFDVLRDTEPGKGGEIQLTDALRTMAQDEPIRAVRYDGVRHDAGDLLGYMKASIDLALRRDELAEELLPWLRERVGEASSS